MALNQCLDFFARNPQIERIPFYDTAGSAKMVMEEALTDAAAIASEVAAKIYGARILRRSIESDRQNFTRFFLLRTPRFARLNPTKAAAKTQWKTSLVFSTRNIPGALFRALSAFALRDLSLTKIESRPLRGKPWEYLFLCGFSRARGRPCGGKCAEPPAGDRRFPARARLLSERRLDSAVDLIASPSFPVPELRRRTARANKSERPCPSGWIARLK